MNELFRYCVRLRKVAYKTSSFHVAVSCNCQPQTVTFFSECVNACAIVQATRPVGGANAFGKNTNFSKPMSEYNKVVVDE